MSYTSTILGLAWKIVSEHTVCDRCLGRFFALAGYGLENQQRGEALKLQMFMDAALAHKCKDGPQVLLPTEEKSLSTIIALAKTGFKPAHMWLQKNQGLFANNTDEPSQDPITADAWSVETETCYYCDGLLEQMDKMAAACAQAISHCEAKTFLVGTNVPLSLLEKQSEAATLIPSEFSETFKSHMNREVGKRLGNLTGLNVDFKRPHVSIIQDPMQEKPPQVKIRSVYFFGRYRKLERGIPQTTWPCRACKGRRRKQTCSECGGTGLKYQTSIEQEIGSRTVPEAAADGFKLHGGGREDIDVLMKGTGRPFVGELVGPKNRPPSYSLEQLEALINKSEKVNVTLHCFTTRKGVVAVKEASEASSKTYVARCSRQSPVTEEQIRSLEKEFKGRKVEQRTPIRVSHRRSDLIRKKIVHELRIIEINPEDFTIEVVCSGGTYVKELISSDQGRTVPSVSSVLESETTCLCLDVTDITSDISSKIPSLNPDDPKKSP